MTVIAYKEGVLAADSRIACDTSITSNNYNKIRVFDNEEVNWNGDRLYAIGFAGTVSDFEMIFQALNSRRWSENFSHECNALIVGHNYVYELEPDKKWLIQRSKKEVVAVGCGEIWALAAMRLGLSAVEAVKFTCKNDMSCGGKVRSWSKK